MPTKRTPIKRVRSPPIAAETVKLFVELNAVPKRQRESQEFKARDKELARQLGLGSEWICDVTSVTDDERVSHRTGIHHESWLKVRAVRERLLAAAGPT